MKRKGVEVYRSVYIVKHEENGSFRRQTCTKLLCWQEQCATKLCPVSEVCVTLAQRGKYRLERLTFLDVAQSRSQQAVPQQAKSSKIINTKLNTQNLFI